VKLFNDHGPAAQMTFESHAHHLIDAFRRRRIHGAGYDEDRERIGGVLLLEQEYASASIFVVREPVNETIGTDLLDLAWGWQAEGRLRLPADHCLFQIRLSDVLPNPETGEHYPDDMWIIHAATETGLANLIGDDMVHTDHDPGPDGGRDDTAFALQIFKTDVDDPHNWFAGPVTARVAHGRVRTYRYRTRREWLDENLDSLSDDCLDAVNFVIGILAMMQSPALEVARVHVPKQINRGRSLLRKSRIRDHSVLRLPKLVLADGERGPGGGTHRRPRPHWRRPHTRHYSDGKTVEIPLTLVARREGDALPPPPVVEIITRR
jgi:hypothetical protein